MMMTNHQTFHSTYLHETYLPGKHEWSLRLELIGPNGNWLYLTDGSIATEGSMVVSLGVKWSKRKLIILDGRLDGNWGLDAHFVLSYFWRRKRCVHVESKKAFLWWVLSPGWSKRKLIISNLGLHKWPFLLHFWNKHHEYNNFCVQLVQKFQILTEKINIEVLLVAH